MMYFEIGYIMAFVAFFVVMREAIVNITKEELRKENVRWVVSMCAIAISLIAILAWPLMLSVYLGRLIFVFLSKYKQ